ncbi:unnamed protein product [Trichobilharzia regenti]|nr:unnamed protein product [Trichobilharzia regenti]
MGTGFEPRWKHHHSLRNAAFSNTTHDRESFVSQKGRPTGESELGGSTLNSPDTMPKTLPPFKRNELNKQDSFSKIRNNTKESSLLKVNNTNKINQQVNKTPKHSSSTLEPLSNLHNQLNEDTELETTSAMSADTNQTVEFNELSKRHRSSDRSAASGRSKSIMGAVEDESLRLENEALRSMLNDANHLISTIKSHTLTLETQLSEKANDIDRLSRELCNLRNRLLIDGLTQYLERA